MLFALICTDKPNSLDLRMSTRPEHLKHLGEPRHGAESRRPLHHR